MCEQCGLVEDDDIEALAQAFIERRAAAREHAEPVVPAPADSSPFPAEPVEPTA